MRKILTGVGVVALLTLGLAAPAHADTVTIDYTLESTDPADSGTDRECTTFNALGLHYTTAAFFVNSDGDYMFSITNNGYFGIYSQPYVSATPTANCLDSGNIVTETLTSNTTYWLYLSTLNLGVTGDFSLTINGPGNIVQGEAPAPSDTTTTVTATPSTTTVGTAITLTATVTGDTPTGEVEFFDGITSLGTATLTDGEATLAYTPTVASTLNVTAVYSGDTNNAPSTSEPVSVTVTAAPAEPEPEPELAATGIDSAPLTAGALGLLLAGTTLVLRRRHTAR